MRKSLILIASIAALACGRDQQFEAGGELDTTADTTARLQIPDIDVGLTQDTLNVPRFGTEKDTVIVDKPVVTGRKPVEVKRPTVDVKRP